ncbi:PadR family transcriptional regulator [Streptomyces sp. VRA16 Mangrove soil]|uniref:PadR family transcriptional regulator n=1 Tax=Streptomyces sp. VRA16 Mangrove soil TaxID=2817434 RepID=UPI001A9D6232|nr:PadR family transcriptional regulator [Streptomyces sp. VRA16 Mangrove soil]MBO1334547.1 PadR family transcriptional regulator [Streptomyces sp. VRA16 Mangrove soil]
MSLKYAVLASLLEGEASGYDLAKIFDVSVSNFWAATPQQLYRELERLAADGLIEARVVPQERRPNKRLFTLTAAGRADLVAFTAKEPRPTAVRDELMVKVQAADIGDTAAVRAHIEERMAWATGKLARYERVRAHLLQGMSEERFLREGERVGPYLTLLRGISLEEENLRWGRRALEILDLRTAGADR